MSKQKEPAATAAKRKSAPRKRTRSTSSTATKSAAAAKPATATRPRKRPSRAAKPAAAAKPKPVVTLAVDIGGTGTKTMLLDESGMPMSERNRQPTPRPATPDAIVDLIVQLANEQGDFDRISVGFPGVVHDGVVATAPNLDPSWKGYALASSLENRLNRPTRVLNDADVQGYGAIEGHGVELVLTLGTGLGSALYVNGRLVPNLELAHHPFAKGRTYEESVGARALKKAGKKKWNKRVQAIIAQLDPIINYRTLFIGGGNAKKLTCELPPNVKLVSNTAGLLGGISLWKD